MSTRATYRFDKGDLTPTITFYIHHDGYLEGAAGYFKDAVLFPTKGNFRGGLAEQFMRANINAQFTDSHEIHADTEYRYTVQPQTHLLKAEHRPIHRDSFHTVFTGTVLDFIKQYEGTQLIRFKGEYLDRQRAMELEVARLGELQRCLDKGWTGNASGVADDAWVLLRWIAETWGKDDFVDMAANVINTADRYFAKAYGWAGQMNISEDDAYAKWIAQFRPLQLSAPKE